MSHPAPHRAPSATPSVGWEWFAAGARGAHAVQFYEDEAFLASAVADFLAAGIEHDQPLLLIAVPAHRNAMLTELRARGVDVEGLVMRGRLVALDAQATLDRFMVDGSPDRERFHRVMCGVLGSCGGNDERPVRAYGEMVDVLWRAGNASAAIGVEALWNELAESQSFALLCAYGMAGFHDESHGPAFEAICREHKHVAPTERFITASEDGRLLEISRLQQRARALETEVARRAELETALREALERERAARETAEQANRAKSDFLAVMSHELRTPLNAIGGHVQLVELGVHGPVTDAQRLALARAQRSQRHLLSLINDLLNLTRTETARIAFAFEAVELGPFLAEVKALLAPMLASKKLTCDILTNGEPLVARADRERTHQILFNLVTNAIKFTPSGGRITLEAKRDVERRSSLLIEVCDTGIGIDPSKAESIFEPFVQLAPRRAGYDDGVGLGLAISRMLARGMGGDLTARPGDVCGAVMTLRLAEQGRRAR